MNLLDLYFNASSLVGFFTVFFVGIVIYARRGKSKINRNWFLISIFASIWSLFFFFIINSSNKSLSIFLRILMDLCGILVVLFWYKFVTIFVKKVKVNNFLNLIVILFTIFMVGLNASPWMIRDMVPKFGFNYYVQADIGYYIFAVYFTGLILIGSYLLLGEYKRSSGVRAEQIKYILFSVLMAFLGGGSTFLLSLGIQIPPYTFILFSLFPLIIAYAIARYRLMDVRLIILRSFAFILLISLITALYAFIASLTALVLKNFLGLSSNVLAGIVIAILVAVGYGPIKKIIERNTNKYFYKLSYNPQELISKVTKISTSIIDPQSLLHSMAEAFEGAFHQDKIAFILYDKDKKLFPIFQEGFERKVLTEFLREKQNVLPKYFDETRDIFVIFGTITMMEIVKSYLTNVGFKKNQVLFLLIATIIVYIGGSTSFLTIYYDIFPFGQTAMLLYPLLITYAIFIKKY